MGRRRGVCWALALLMCGCSLSGLEQGVPPHVVVRLEAVPGQSQWFRGNLHAHDLWSDGDDFPESVAAWYRGAGYHFLALTNHDTVMQGEQWRELGRIPGGDVALARRQQAWAAQPLEVRPGVHGDRVRLLDFDTVASLVDVPGRFVLLRGVEVSDSFEALAVHLNVLNPAVFIPPSGGSDPVSVIERNLAAYGAPGDGATGSVAIQLNHPNFGRSLTPEQVMRGRALRLMEIYNGHPISRDGGDALRPSMELVWDRVLTHRIATLDLPLVYGTAADDAHHFLGLANGGARPGRGWVQVLAPTLERSALANALVDGRFYASSGVELVRIVHSPKGIRIEVADEPGVDYQVEFIGTRAGFDTATHAALDRFGRPVYASRSYDPAIGAVLSRVEGHVAEYRFRDDDLYVRARVTASRRHPDPSRPLEYQRAWTQPVEGPGAADARANARPELAPPVPEVALHREAVPRFLPLDDAASLARQRTSTCSIDVVRRGDNRSGEVIPFGTSVYVGGWIADPSLGRPPDSIGLMLAGASNYFAEGPNGSARPDVAKALGQGSLEGSGFDISARLDGVASGEYELHLYSFAASGAAHCAQTRRVVIGPAQP